MSDLVAMPKHLIGKFHNACVDPCDMLVGPCACGAWHHWEEWDIEKVPFKERYFKRKWWKL